MTREVPLTRGYVALVDDADYDDVMRFKWKADLSPRKTPTASRSQRYQTGKNCKTIFLYRYIMKPPAGMTVDHIDGNRLNCQRSNLRICTNAENVRNSKRSSNNKSGYKGVDWYAAQSKWRATITFKQKQMHLGYFDNIEDAAQAYRDAAVKYFGEFARFE